MPGQITMYSSIMANFVDNIILLGRIKAKAILRNDAKEKKLSYMDIYVFRVISLLMKDLKHDRIPIALIYKVIPALDTAISRTVSSLEERRYVRRSYERVKGGGRRRIFVALTPLGKRVAISLSKHDQAILKMAIRDLIENKLPRRIRDKTFLWGTQLVLRELHKALINEVREEERKLLKT